jgi:predicted MFS family arabinose efflux permease
VPLIDLDPSAWSRVNAVLMSTIFLGMSTGAAIASQVFTRFGWFGVMVVGAVAASLALVVRLLPERARLAS